jgi:ribosomal protein L9
LVLREPIKSLGEHAVSIKLHPRVLGTFQVEVVSESEVAG